MADARPAGSAHTGSVLVVDDEEAMRDSCRQVLGRAGYEVIVAAEARTGLALLRDQRPDVALVDLKMPGMGGQEMLRRMPDESPETVPVVITGYATLESAVQAIKEGAHDFLPKPFTPEELRTVVRRSIERHRLVHQLAALERDKEQMRDKFAAMISHQLKSPLVAVAEQVEVLKNGLAGEVPPEQCAIVNRMAVRIEGLLALISDWTLLSGTDSVALAETAADVDLAALVREAVDRERGLSDEGAGTLDVQTVAGAVVHGEANLLREAVGNLVSNALKYTPADGRVSVRVAVEGGTCFVTVTDTGIGIPEAELPYVFEDFYRGKGAKERGGTGLGLTIARRIAELHGGSISVTSTPGEGSTFTIRLPRAAGAATGSGEEHDGTDSQVRG